MDFKAICEPPLFKWRFFKRILFVMRLTAAILLFACLTASATGNTQMISLHMENAPIKKVLKEIIRQAKVTILYDEDHLKGAKPVTIKVSNASVKEVLDACFKDQPLKYNIEGKTIFILNKPIEKAIVKDPIDVKGKVVDENGKAVPGVTVTVKGTNKQTLTNDNGEFTLAGVEENAVLSFSSVNMEPFTVNVSGKKEILAKLKTKTSQLDEVQIIAYGQTTKRFQTGNVTTIKGEDIEKQPVQNPLLALQGRVPGIEVTQLTGMPGGGVTVRVQGRNSIQSGLDPLIVIDGVPYPSQFSNAYMESIVAGGSPLNYINPSDIESISVLKDADATAIYGSRAANGAILITTKKAKPGKPTLSIDLQQGWGKVTRFAKMMNTRQYLDMRYEAYENDGIDLATQSVGFNNYDLKFWDTTRYTNWQKELIGGKAEYTNVNAGVSGGSENVQYLVGANFNRQTTVFPGNFDNQAGGLHFNLNGTSPNERLRVQLTGTYTYNQNKLPQVDLTRAAILFEPNAPMLYNEDGTLNWAPNASGSSTFNNPLAEILYSDFTNITKNLVSSLSLAYKILPGLTLSSNFGYSSLHSDLFNGIKLEFVNPETRPFFQRQAVFGNRDVSSWIIEPQIQFTKTLSKSSFETLLGMTIQKSSGNYLIVETFGQPTNELLHTLSAATSISSPNIGPSAEYITRFNGLFGRLNYKYDDKYLVNLTGRRDGSSKFGDDNKFHNFWSIGMGWIFSEEKWIQRTLPFISFGKLRASYGITGNDQIADYSYLSLYDMNNPNILYQGGTGFIINRLSNPLLQWEETRKLQGGIDLSLFNERVTIGATYVRNRSSNQLINYSLPDITGFTSFPKNLPATIQNTSWEFYLNTINIKGKNFTWSTNLNLTIPRNKVVNFSGIELTSYASGNQGVIIGEPIGIRKLWEYSGVDPETGNYMILDNDGKPVSSITYPIEQNATVSLLPKYYGGISNTLSYKGFQLDFLLQFVYQMGSKDLFYVAASGAPGSFLSGQSNQPASVLNRWQKVGDHSTIGRYTTDRWFMIWPYNHTNAGYSYAAGSYIRVKNVSLSWQLPEHWSRKAHLQSARIYFRGQNLATFTKYTGIDPETRSISTLPPLQIWTVGAKIEL